MNIECYSEYYIQGSDHYLVPVDEFSDIFNEIHILEKQNKFLIERENKLQTLEMGQKKFIKYLKDMLDDENDIFSVVRVKEVLDVYKALIK